MRVRDRLAELRLGNTVSILSIVRLPRTAPSWVHWQSPMKAIYCPWNSEVPKPRGPLGTSVLAAGKAQPG